MKARSILEGKKIDLLSKNREIDEVEKRNEIILQTQRERVKSFLYTKQDEHCDSRFEIERNFKFLHDENDTQKKQLDSEIRNFKKELKT